MYKHFMRGALRSTVLVCISFMRNSLALIGLTALLVGGLVAAHGSMRIMPEENAQSATLPGSEGGFVTGLVGLSLPAPEPVHELAREFPTPVAMIDNETRREPVVTPVVLTPLGQANIARYLSRKYHLSTDAIGLMIRESYSTGHEVGLDPALLLAVIGVESGFNPFAESGVGAQGLMQVMSKVHSAKFEEYGGTGAALDPVANIKIGAFILKDCIRRGGSVQGGLRLYVGSTSEEGTGYGVRVLQERERIQLAAAGGNPPVTPVAVQPIHPAVAAHTVNTAKAPATNHAQTTNPAPAKSAQAHLDNQPRADAQGAPRARDKLAAL